MFEKEFHISKLVAARLRGELSPEMEAELKAWVDKDPANQKLITELEQEHLLSEKLDFYESADREAIWNKAITQLKVEGFEQHTTVEHKIKLWPRLSVAIAAAIAVIVLGVYFFNISTIKESDGKNQYVADAAPGINGATLTLASGEKIRLSDTKNGQLASQSGVSISKTADGQLVYKIKPAGTSHANLAAVNTLSTANGETYRVQLPDNSRVWLNSASSLTFSANLLENGKRRVTLRGEGYFEITKDKAHPFVVKTNQQEVEVLGTQFNINSYEEESTIATTLVEGSVKVTSGKEQKVIKPGEQLSNSANQLKIARVDLDNVLDWKNGDFNLNHVNFKAAMRKIARWYDVELVYDASVPDEMEAGGWLSRNKKLSEVLQTIEGSGQVKFRIEGKKIIVSK